MYSYVARNQHLQSTLVFISKDLKNFQSLKTIKIYGNKILNHDFIVEFLNINIGQNMYLISPEKLCNKLLTLSEIKDAKINLNYAGILSIDIAERIPFAIWWNRNSKFLVDKKGHKITKKFKLREYKDLIIIFGENFQQALQEFINYTSRFKYRKDIRILHFIGNRRWDVYMNSNIIIKLPEKNLELSLKKCEEILDNDKYKNRVNIIDLRLFPKKVYFKIGK